MQLILNGEVIWENPPELGHFGITLRKQIREEEIIRRVTERFRQRKMRLVLASKLDDIILLPDDGTTAESPEDIRRSYERRRDADQ